jgi:hypothetical protein
MKSIIDKLALTLPSNPAPAAMSLKARNLCPVFKGESFEWIDSKAGMKKKKGKKKK